MQASRQINAFLDFLKTAESVEKKFKDVSVVRKGSQIVLPEGMTYAEGRLWLKRQEDAEEKNVAISYSIPCFPLDGVIAMRRAMEEMFGFAAYSDTPTFFGPKPPTMIQVKMPDGAIETAPIGRMQPPMFEGGYINAHCGEMTVNISGEVKKKFEPQVKQLMQLTQKILTEQSIYRGAAFILDLQWKENELDFHPVNHAPVFMDVKHVDEEGLILNQDTHFALTANIFTLIEQTEACRRNAIPLKHGCLLAGPYGTGKTMTARVTASKAVRNKWTFIYLKTPSQIATALLMAQMYAPAVVFTEDIDDVVSGERDDDLNNILNTLDGVDTKDKPIITVLTSNHPEQINPAMLRAGRIDTVIPFGEPDAEAALRFVRLYCKDSDSVSLLADISQEDGVRIGEALKGYVPAFIAESVQKAKRYAIHRLKGDDIVGQITADDIVAAAQALRSHQAMVERKKVETASEKIAKAAVTLLNAPDEIDV